MEKLNVPDGLKGPRENGSALAVGPFCLVHNGEKSAGFFLEDHGDVWVLSDGSRDFALNDSYKIQSNASHILFKSAQFDSTFLLRPLTQNDVAWITPDEPENDINDLKELLLDGVTNQYSNGG
jgi:hypothetical protein